MIRGMEQVSGLLRRQDDKVGWRREGSGERLEQTLRTRELEREFEQRDRVTGKGRTERE